MKIRTCYNTLLQSDADGLPKAAINPGCDSVMLLAKDATGKYYKKYLEEVNVVDGVLFTMSLLIVLLSLPFSSSHDLANTSVCNGSDQLLAEAGVVGGVGCSLPSWARSVSSCFVESEEKHLLVDRYLLIEQ